MEIFKIILSTLKVESVSSVHIAISRVFLSCAKVYTRDIVFEKPFSKVCT